jgi:hypothetical protein
MITAQVAKIRLIFMLNPILRHLGSRLQLHQAGTEHARRVDPTFCDNGNSGLQLSQTGLASNRFYLLNIGLPE